MPIGISFSHSHHHITVRSGTGTIAPGWRRNEAAAQMRAACAACRFELRHAIPHAQAFGETALHVMRARRWCCLAKPHTKAFPSSSRASKDAICTSPSGTAPRLLPTLLPASSQTGAISVVA